jgi:undecaprenyl diphosphate synthase
MIFKRTPKIHMDNIPAHVAVIMDGNGRWAKKRGLPRAEGHRQGAEVIDRLTDAAIELGIKYVSVYAFSTENWSRPKEEIAALWKLLELFFHTKIETLDRKGVRITHSGSRKKLPRSVLSIIEKSVEKTKSNRTITLNLCLNYGGRQEIVDAVNSWIPSRKKNEPFTAKKLGENLYRPDIPDVDLLIRTSGESRISNFLLWQSSYAEFIIMDVLWPDFSRNDMFRAIAEYQKRSRRFGGL